MHSATGVPLSLAAIGQIWGGGGGGIARYLAIPANVSAIGIAIPYSAIGGCRAVGPLSLQLGWSLSTESSCWHQTPLEDSASKWPLRFIVLHLLNFDCSVQPRCWLELVAEMAQTISGINCFMSLFVVRSKRWAFPSVDAPHLRVEIEIGVP